jgi:tetratricopeptide (TPR) repeat protein
MTRLSTFLSAFAALALGTIALADDEILLKTKAAKAKGFVVSESTKEVVLKGGAKFAVDDIDDIIYDWQSADPLAGINYNSGFTSERAWLTASDAKKRAAAYTSALDSFEKAFLKATDKRIKAHLDFKLGYLRGKKALEDNSDPKIAIARLRDFATKNPGAWQIARTLTLLAKLQSDSKDFQGAELSFAEIAKLDVTEETKNEARLQGALINLQLGKVAVAESKLEELLKALPKGSKSHTRALIAKGECLIAGKKSPEAVAVFKQAINESGDDKSVKASAYNALGVHLYETDQLKEARWEFLWVDVVYNQDRPEHARALYYLCHVFEKLGELEKAAQCRATLLDPAFGGTEFQRKLQKEQSK